MKRKFLLWWLFAGVFVWPAVAQIQHSAPLYLLHYDYVRRWRFGFSMGLNVFDYTAVNSNLLVQLPGEAPEVLRADVVDVIPGFTINGIVNYRLSHYLNLRAMPGICFGVRSLNFYRADGSLLHSMHIESNYAEAPVLLKYSAKRVSNYRPYMVAGVNSRFNMNWKTREQKGTYISSAIFEPFYEAGFGLDVYFYYFKLSIEFKYSGGFLNGLGRGVVDGYEGYHMAIDRLNSQIFIFALHIE
ncbi:MAG: PorT family protein [Prevotellaceae bacterium]|nr:PorT family protein [Prevotellaceae bacterium]